MSYLQMVVPQNVASIVKLLLICSCRNITTRPVDSLHRRIWNLHPWNQNLSGAWKNDRFDGLAQPQCWVKSMMLYINYIIIALLIRYTYGITWSKIDHTHWSILQLTFDKYGYDVIFGKGQTQSKSAWKKNKHKCISIWNRCLFQGGVITHPHLLGHQPGK